jgi:hypothetical protein
MFKTDGGVGWGRGARGGSGDFLDSTPIRRETLIIVPNPSASDPCASLLMEQFFRFGAEQANRPVEEFGGKGVRRDGTHFASAHRRSGPKPVE